MPDENNAGNGNQPINNSSDGGNGTDPTKTVNQSQETVDVSKLGDDAFEKVFDDPRLWNHPRFKGLNERAKKADAYEEAQKKDREAKLLEEKKYQELIADKDKEITTLREAQKTSTVDSRIVAEASKVGVKSLEAVLKLVDRSAIKVDESGNITGVTEAVKALLDKETYLKGNPGSAEIGSPTNPGSNDGSGKFKFKLSQLQDANFYRENNKNGEIDKAVAAGQVEDDMTK